MAENGTFKTDFATKARMLGLPASTGAPALAETGGLAVSQLLPPWAEQKYFSTLNLCFSDFVSSKATIF